MSPEKLPSQATPSADAFSAPPTAPGAVSIVIKALNEERKIATAIESSLAALSRCGGEVILADSCSTDRTVEIASAYPIFIVQLERASERCCGIGPQLGFQHARCEFVYILDGDMKMRPGFLDEALAFLREHPAVGGVGGLVVENNLDSLEFQARVERGTASFTPGLVDRLDMGGLYRRAALEQVGYMSDRNLHSYEEFDLALRLRAGGWELHRIDVPAVDHYGHDMSAYSLLARRWRSRYINGSGEVLRAALGKPHAPLLLREFNELKIYLAVLGWLLAAAVVALLQPGFARALVAVAFFLGLPWLAYLWKKGSVAKATYAYASVVANAGGLLRGFLGARVSPRLPVASRVLRIPEH